MSILAGCSSGGRVGSSGSDSDPCLLLAPPSAVPDTVVVGLAVPVNPVNAPSPRNLSEALVFGHLYESLVTQDCGGEPRPGLAGSWSSHNGGLVWKLELRARMRFSDGTRVDATDVVDAWRSTGLGVVADTVAAEGAGTVVIYLGSPSGEVPEFVSSAEYSVFGLRKQGSWNIGTGPYRLAASYPDDDGVRRRTIIPMLTDELTRPSDPAVTFLEFPNTDPRDILDSGVDMLFTRDRTAIRYAEMREDWQSLPLPWDTSYLLLLPSRAAAVAGGDIPPRLSSGFREAMATDAIRADARSFSSPSWVEDLSHCMAPRSGAASSSTVSSSTVSSSTVSSSTVSSSTVSSGTVSSGTASSSADAAASPVADRRIIHDLADPIAADVAARIVALATVGTSGSEATGLAGMPFEPELDGQPLVSHGVDSAELETLVRAGQAFAYIVPVMRRPPSACYAARDLLERAPWLAAAGSELAASLLPLVDVRAHALVRRDVVGLHVDGRGRIRISGGQSGIAHE